MQGKKGFILILKFISLSEMVNCGGHSAIHCAACPDGNGEGWCNGECEWKNGQCVHSHCKYCYYILKRQSYFQMVKVA